MNVFIKISTYRQKLASNYELFNIHFIDPLLSISLEYKKAADKLSRARVNDIKNTNTAYPILWNYRHFLELQLKYYISKSNNLLDKERIKIINYNLESLWEIAKKNILEICHYGTMSIEFKITENIIREFNNIDPNGMTFRYPYDTKDNEILIDIYLYDCNQLSTAINVIEKFFASAFIEYNYYQIMKQLESESS